MEKFSKTRNKKKNEDVKSDSYSFVKMSKIAFLLLVYSVFF